MKCYILIAALILAGCASSDRAEGNVDTASNVFEAFNEHDWKRMGSYYSDSIKILDVAYGTEYVTKSRNEMVIKYRKMEEMFPDIRDSVVGIYPSGGKVIIEFVSSGKMNDSISFSIPIISVLTLEDGLIVKDATYYHPENH